MTQFGMKMSDVTKTTFGCFPHTCNNFYKMFVTYIIYVCKLFKYGRVSDQELWLIVGLLTGDYYDYWPFQSYRIVFQKVNSAFINTVFI